VVVFCVSVSLAHPLVACDRVKVASGKLVFHYLGKVSNGPKCGDCGRKLAGIQHLRPKEYRTISKRQKVVSRAYGGNKCHICVRDRVVRAFLVEVRMDCVCGLLLLLLFVFSNVNE
jgi:ribosomal protein L34E